jgi:phage FluMu gp28-like protein
LASKGPFWIGVDLGKKVDFSVIAVVTKESDLVRLVYYKRWPLETPYSTVIGSIKIISERLRNVQRILVDQTGVGEYIVEDMKKGRLRNVEGVMLSLPMKQEILGHLKQLMQDQRFTYPFDVDLTTELNVERFELTKTGQIMLSHPEGTHDDILWAVALAVYATRQAPFPKLSKPHATWVE